MLAHELRNSLSSVYVSSDILLTTPDVREELRAKLVLNINQGVQTMTKRLDELLEMARFSKGNVELKLEYTNLLEFLEGVIEAFRPNLDKRSQKLIADIDLKLPSITIDRSRIEQVIINILSNASKYGPENSEINLKVSTGPKGLLLKSPTTGQAFHPRTIKYLFQPYFRAAKTKGHSPHRNWSRGYPGDLSKRMGDRYGSTANPAVSVPSAYISRRAK